MRRRTESSAAVALLTTLLVTACGGEPSPAQETDAELLASYAAAERQALRSDAATQLQVTVRRERQRALFRRQEAEERLSRPSTGLAAWGGGRGQWNAAQAAQAMAQTHESRARAAEAKLREHLAQAIRTTLGEDRFARAVALRSDASRQRASVSK